MRDGVRDAMLALSAWFRVVYSSYFHIISPIPPLADQRRLTDVAHLTALPGSERKYPEVNPSNLRFRRLRVSRGASVMNTSQSEVACQAAKANIM